MATVRGEEVVIYGYFMTERGTYCDCYFPCYDWRQPVAQEEIEVSVE